MNEVSFYGKKPAEFPDLVHWPIMISRLKYLQQESMSPSYASHPVDDDESHRFGTSVDDNSSLACRVFRLLPALKTTPCFP